MLHTHTHTGWSLCITHILCITDDTVIGEVGSVCVCVGGCGGTHIYTHLPYIIILNEHTHTPHTQFTLSKALNKLPYSCKQGDGWSKK